MVLRLQKSSVRRIHVKNPRHGNPYSRHLCRHFVNARPTLAFLSRLMRATRQRHLLAGNY
jgi:hypothetical protein